VGDAGMQDPSSLTSNIHLVLLCYCAKTTNWSVKYFAFF